VWPLKRAYQNHISTLDKKNYPRMIQTKFGDHPSISAVGDDVNVFLFLALETPKRGQSFYYEQT
jgi:hypothetical protein